MGKESKRSFGSSVSKAPLQGAGTIGLLTRDTSGCRQALLGIHVHIPREGQTYVHSS